MARRPVGRGGLLGTAARTAVVAGTATAVAGGVARRQSVRAEQAAHADAYQAHQVAAEQAAMAEPPSPPVPPAGGSGSMADLERLVELKAQGALSDAEFAAAKAKLLGL
jgi:hypothetical protein